MALIDNRGRLFGMVSLIDLGAAIVVVVAVVAIFFFRGNEAGPVLAIGNNANVPVEVDIIARRMSLRSLDIIQTGAKANIIIRNQPYGEVDVVNVEDASRTVPVVLPDGEIQRLTEESYSKDVVVTVAGNAAETDDGIVLGNSKVKVGIPIEIETKDYLLRGTVMDVRKAPEGE